MYEERRDSFSIKGFILQVLIVLLFVFLMLWLFPTKKYINESISGLQSEQDLKKLEVLYGEIFANNIERMKDGAIGYFTDDRLPKVIGQSKKMTLKEMYGKHLLLEITDENGKACSINNSYVEITKYDNEYQMRVNLQCGKKEDYIIVYMGCYTYCEKGICEKQVNSATSKTKPSKKYCKVENGKYYDAKGNIVNKGEYEKSCSNKKYLYEYKLITGGKTNCSTWGQWNKIKIESTSNVVVETKTEKEKTGTKQEQYISDYKIEKKEIIEKQKQQVGTTYEKQKTGTKEEQYVSSYKTEKVVVGTKKVQTGTTTKKVTEKVQTGTTKVFVKSDSGKTIPNNSTTYTYEKTGSTTKKLCSTCSNTTIYYWDVYKKVPVYKMVTKTTTVPVYSIEYIYETKKVPVYSTRKVDVYTTKEVPVYSVKLVTVQKENRIPVYSTRQVPIYTDVIYYRSKTCSTTAGKTYYKWSNSSNDRDLINKGYKLTGNVKQI